MRADPINQLLGPGRLGISKVRGSEHTNEYLSLMNFARRWIDNRGPLAGVVDERLYSGDVMLVRHRAQPPLEPTQKITKAANPKYRLNFLTA